MTNEIMKKSFQTPLRFLALTFLLISGLVSFAQVPKGINYQAVVRDGGNLLNNQVVDVRFTFMTAGVELYQETQNLSTDDRGLIHAIIGTGTPLLGSMDSIPWETGAVELKVAMDAGGGFVNLGTTSMESVPFSMYAQQVADLSPNHLEDLGNVVIDSSLQPR